MSQFTSTLTTNQRGILNVWERFAMLYAIVSVAALVPPIGSLLAPHIGSSLNGLMFFSTLVYVRMATREQILEYSWVRNFISIVLVVTAAVGAVHIMLIKDSQFNYNPWLTVSAIQPLVTIVLPGIWLVAFWVVRSGGTNVGDH